MGTAISFCTNCIQTNLLSNRLMKHTVLLVILLIHIGLMYYMHLYTHTPTIPEYSSPRSTSQTHESGWLCSGWIAGWGREGKGG